MQTAEIRAKLAEAPNPPQEPIPLRAVQRKPRSRVRLLGVIGLGALLAIAVIGIVSREHHEAVLVRQTRQSALPFVETITPQLGVKPRPLVLPGEIKAFYAAPIYSQVSGYVKMWYKDIGARVKAGDVLATIETPDLDQQLAQALAALAEARANARLAVATAHRWRKLLTSQSVSQQETDVKSADAEARLAKVNAAEANVSRLRALERFKQLVAPFDGIVTARKVDVGALVTADKTSEPELFEVSDIHKVRIYVKVPQADSAEIAPGMRARLYLPQYPDKSFDAKLVTVSNAVNPTSRTELVELLANNPADQLTPGTFTEVHFQLPPNPRTVRIPTSALIFQEHGLQVAVLGPNDRIELRKIRVGADLGTEIEVLSGLRPGERVVDSPPATLIQGEQVRVANAAPAADGAEHASEANGQ